jgi:hypothetical protein
MTALSRHHTLKPAKRFLQARFGDVKVGMIGERAGSSAGRVWAPFRNQSGIKWIAVHKKKAPTTTLQTST